VTRLTPSCRGKARSLVAYKVVPEESIRVSRPRIARPLVEASHGDANHRPGATLLADIQSWYRLSDFQRHSVEFIFAASKPDRRRLCLSHVRGSRLHALGRHASQNLSTESLS
jgi:hypothetical protein